METAKTIYRQLYGQDANLMICILARDFIGHDDGLRFTVTGAKFKGYVYIRYNRGLDLYEVELAKFQNHEWTVKKTIEGVYFDMLPDILERYVY